MNDDNLDHHEQHDHTISAEHEQGAEAAEAWHGHEPPIDDFSDPASEATVSEETDAAEDIAVPVEMVRSSHVALMAAAAIGSVLLIGAVIYWQFGSMLHNTPQTPRPISVTQNAAPKPLPADLVKDDGISQNSLAQPTAPAAIPQPPPVPPVVEATPAAPAQAPSSAVAPLARPDMPVGQAAMASAPAPIPVNPASIPVTAAPAVAVAPAAVPAPTPVPSAQTQPAVTPVVTQQAPAKAAAPTASGGSNDNRVAELTARVDELQKALAQATQQLSQIGDKVGNTAAGTSSDANERIARLEQTIAQLQQQKSVSGAKTAMVSETDAPVATVSHKKHHTKAASVKTHHKNASDDSFVAKGSGRWVLRAASPDEAWVSKTASSRDLRPVHVGDTLPGIGRVKSIDQVGDGWVVKGTSGSVH